MNQLTQKLKTGEMRVLEVPTPLLRPGMLLIRNHYSLISVGTERSTVKAARKNLLGKAKARPQQAKQVLELYKQQGPVQTYRAVMKKLDCHSPLGYSSAGEVVDVARDVRGFGVGDLVACGGTGYANHAEIVAVPTNLCVKLPGDADLKRAAYNTLGAIALQGIRQADLRIGESCAVIGLGLIGQLTGLLLKAGGIRVVGIDIDPEMVQIASDRCADLTFLRDEPGLDERIDEFTGGIGLDGVIITAAANTIDPVNLAGRIARQKGKVVVVGDVPTGFERTHYYKKELELRMSCSYGPGRYDTDYEEKGIDYPVGYVRWTENRNMNTFQELVYSGKINIDYLTTHTFKLENAPAAYEMILDRKEPLLGILIEYDVEKPIKNEKVHLQARLPASRSKLPLVSIGFIGAGSYAMNHLLPNISEDKNVVLRGVMTSSGTSSRTVAEKYGFEFCTSDEDDILRNSDINTVFIVTRHNTHAQYVVKALAAGKHVFVEKPLCLKESELTEIQKIYTSRITHNGGPILMAGLNRRFSPLTETLKQRIGEGPMAMICRVNAGGIPADAWIQDRDVGGGRIIGEVCHFVDFLTFLNGSLPERVFAMAMPDPAHPEDTVNLSLHFKNGSIGTISYFSNGSKSLLKEYIEIHRAGNTGVLRDFKELEIFSNGRPFKKKLLYQDKGQRSMLRTFLDSVKKGEPSPIPFDEICAMTLVIFRTIESLRTGKACPLAV